MEVELIEPFGGTEHFLVHLNSDTGHEDGDFEWFGLVNLETKQFSIYKKNLIVDSGNKIQGQLNMENPHALISLKINSGNWNGLGSLMLSIGLLIAGGDFYYHGFGIFGVFGTLLSVSSLFTPRWGADWLKKEFYKYLTHYNELNKLRLKDEMYRRDRRASKRS